MFFLFVGRFFPVIVVIRLLMEPPCSLEIRLIGLLYSQMVANF